MFFCMIHFFLLFPIIHWMIRFSDDTLYFLVPVKIVSARVHYYRCSKSDCVHLSQKSRWCISLVNWYDAFRFTRACASVSVTSFKVLVYIFQSATNAYYNLLWCNA